MVERGALATLVRLRAEVEIDARALDERARETAALLARGSGGEALDRESLIVLAVNVHGYYTALETLLERIARLLDESVPTGPTWHVDLVRQMSLELPKTRPAVVPSELGADLHELRKFRHFFRNAYVLELEADRTLEQGLRVARVHSQLAASLRAFVGHLSATIDALAESA